MSTVKGKRLGPGAHAGRPGPPRRPGIAAYGSHAIKNRTQEWNRAGREADTDLRPIPRSVEAIGSRAWRISASRPCVFLPDKYANVQTLCMRCFGGRDDWRHW